MSSAWLQQPNNTADTMKHDKKKTSNHTWLEICTNCRLEKVDIEQSFPLWTTHVSVFWVQAHNRLDILTDVIPVFRAQQPNGVSASGRNPFRKSCLLVTRIIVRNMMLQVYGKCHFLFLCRSMYLEKSGKNYPFFTGTLFRALSTRSALPFCPLNALVLIICSMHRAHQHTQTPTRALQQQRGNIRPNSCKRCALPRPLSTSRSHRTIDGALINWPEWRECFYVFRCWMTERGSILRGRERGSFRYSSRNRLMFTYIAT